MFPKKFTTVLKKEKKEEPDKWEGDGKAPWGRFSKAPRQCARPVMVASIRMVMPGHWLGNTSTSRRNLMVMVMSLTGDSHLYFKVNIFSLIDLRLQLPYHGCICRTPVFYLSWSLINALKAESQVFSLSFYFLCPMRAGKKVFVFLLSLSFLLPLSNAKSPEYALHLEAVRVGKEVDALGHDRRDRNLWSDVLPCTCHLFQFVTVGKNRGGLVLEFMM